MQEMRPNILIIGYSLCPHGIAQWITKILEISIGIRVVLLVPDISPVDLSAILVRGVSAILHIEDARDHLIPAVFAAGPQSILSPRVVSVIGHLPPPGHMVYLLSKTELTIALLLLAGYSSRSITSLLLRSQQTIEWHRRNIKEKLGVTGGKHSLISYLVPFTLWISNSVGNLTNKREGPFQIPQKGVLLASKKKTLLKKSR